MVNNRTILVADADKPNREILCEILSKNYNIMQIEDLNDALAVLRKNAGLISAIIINVMSTKLDGYQFLEKQQQDATISGIPVIVTTDNNDEEFEAKILSLGAYDFLLKPYKPAIIIHRFANMMRLRETSSFVNIVKTDSLTGLYNKEYFYQKVENRLENEPNTKFDIICVDIERFKLVNDLFSAVEGDKLLKYIANLIKDSIYSVGLCGRLSGDIFIIFVPRPIKYENEMFKTYETKMQNYPLNINIVLKYGIYKINDRTIPINVMCDRAKLAVESIKGKYDIDFAYYDRSIREKLLNEQLILDNMKSALIDEQFEVYFQPKYDLLTEKIAGVEALVRWLHPEKGFMPPATFIPLFEKNGFITDLDCYVWDKTCEKMRAWIDLGNRYTVASVNVSRTDIYNPHLPTILLGIIKKHNLTPEHLHLEITETAYTEDPSQLVEMVRKLKNIGFIIEMDDFGTGYSSLNMLSELPIDVVKLDMRFLRSKSIETDGGTIIEFIINLAHCLNLFVIAEGVETHEQVSLLRELGCDYAQGFYYSKPLPQSEFEDLLLKSNLAEAKPPLKLSNTSEVALLKKKLVMAKQEIKTIMKNLDGGIVIMTSNSGGVITPTFVSEGFCKMTGTTMGEMHNIYDYNVFAGVHPNDKQRVEKMYRKAIADRQKFSDTYRLICGDGSYIWVHITANIIEEADGNISYYAIFTDATKEKQAEENFKISERTMQVIMEQTGINFWVYDIVNKSISMSCDSQHIFGSTKNVENVPEILESLHIIHPDDLHLVLEMYNKIIKGEKAAATTARWKNSQTGKFGRCNITYTTIFDENGVPVKAIGSAILV